MAAAVVFQERSWFYFDVEKFGLLCSWRLQVGSQGRACWWGRSPGKTMTYWIVLLLFILVCGPGDSSAVMEFGWGMTGEGAY